MKPAAKTRDQISFQTSVVMEEYYDMLEEDKKKKQQLISDITKWKYLSKVNRVREDRKDKPNNRE